MASNGFPCFSDGNVEIHFNQSDDKYVLHSHVLALHSSWFSASLSERWNDDGEYLVGRFPIGEALEPSCDTANAVLI